MSESIFIPPLTSIPVKGSPYKSLQGKSLNNNKRNHFFLTHYVNLKIHPNLVSLWHGRFSLLSLTKWLQFPVKEVDFFLTIFQLLENTLTFNWKFIFCRFCFFVNKNELVCFSMHKILLHWSGKNCLTLTHMCYIYSFWSGNSAQV